MHASPACAASIIFSIQTRLVGKAQLGMYRCNKLSPSACACDNRVVVVQQWSPQLVILRARLPVLQTGLAVCMKTHKPGRHARHESEYKGTGKCNMVQSAHRPVKGVTLVLLQSHGAPDTRHKVHSSMTPSNHCKHQAAQQEQSGISPDCS